MALTGDESRRGLTPFTLALVFPTTSGSFSCSRSRDSSPQSGTAGMYGALGAGDGWGCGHESLFILVGIVNVCLKADRRGERNIRDRSGGTLVSLICDG